MNEYDGSAIVTALNNIAAELREIKAILREFAKHEINAGAQVTSGRQSARPTAR